MFYVMLRISIDSPKFYKAFFNEADAYNSALALHLTIIPEQIQILVTNTSGDILFNFGTCVDLNK